MTVATGYSLNRINLGVIAHWFGVRAAVYFAALVASSVLFLAGSAIYVALWPSDLTPANQAPLRTNVPSISVPQEVYPKDGLVAGNEGSEVIPASTLLGLKIYGPGAEKIGQVSEVYMDRGGKTQAVVVGLDEKYWRKKKWIAIPFKDVDLIFEKSQDSTKIDRGVVPYSLPYLEHLPLRGHPLLSPGQTPKSDKNN